MKMIERYFCVQKARNELLVSEVNTLDEQKFLCGHCGKMTQFVKKKDDLSDGVQHNYAACQRCGHKHTIMYTNFKIRQMMMKQRRTRRPDRKQLLAFQITQGAEELRLTMESLK